MGQSNGLTKKECLDMLMLLSALESWALSVDKRLPDYLHDQLSAALDRLTKEVLSE